MKFSRMTVALMIELGLILPAFSSNVLAADTSAEQATQTTSSDESNITQGKTVVVVAAKQTLQAPGVSQISATDLKKNPPARDISEIIRTMPGVNLTGNSTSGQRGNNRQIDIRGMGPENTLILVDGMPVTSRNSVRLGWRGERDTRGDTSWVPPEVIDHIDVIRGPAAARYGNGAEGGVVNIITKAPTHKWHGSWDTYLNAPQHADEGSTKRTNFSLSGPASEDVTVRLYGNYSHTDPDAQDINADHAAARTGTYAGTYPAGREGSVNKDINGLVHWQVNPANSLEFKAGYSRQGNLYAGDTQNTNSNAYVLKNYDNETNRLYRTDFGLTWDSEWDHNITSKTYMQYENTRNSRISEGLAGGTEGIFSSSDSFSTIRLDDFILHSEASVPFTAWVDQTATVGAEWNHQHMTDGTSTAQALSYGGGISGESSTGRSPYSSAEIYSVFAEDNMAVTDTTDLVPGLRYDHHTISGDNVSPSLNLSQKLHQDVTLKMGIASAYKAPSLYQTNPNYILYSNGQGCADSSAACYLQGNADLKAETSINKEIGLEYDHEGLQAGITWFRNDYRNKIEAGTDVAGTSTNGKVNVYQWDNVPRAVVEGLEGTFNTPLAYNLSLKNNMTYMLQSKNKDTGDYLSVIPDFTLNSNLNWQATDDLSLQTSLTLYGTQKPKKYDYHGNRVSGSDSKPVSPYAIFGFSGTYDINKYVSVTSGIDNLFDKRLFREGNAQTTGNATTKSYLYGAGANTYNEAGRTYFVKLSTHF